MPSPDVSSLSGVGRHDVVPRDRFLTIAPDLPTDHRRDRKWPRPWPQFLLLMCVVYAGLLLFATHAPQLSPPRLTLGTIPTDKTLHLAAYGVLGALATLTAKAVGWNDVRSILCLYAGLALFACADESTQLLCGRAADCFDWVADIIGAGTAVALVLAIGLLRQRATGKPK
jgi:VanZ family protein